MSRRRSGGRAGFAAALAGLALAASCSSTAASDGAATIAREAPRSGGHLTVGLESDPNGLDPMRNAWDPAALSVANAIYDPWAAYDANGVVQPYLAEAIIPDASFTTWTMRLRPGVRFHDQTALNADATVKWWRAAKASPVVQSALAYVDGAEKVDDLTVVVHLNRPWSSFPTIFTTQAGYVVSPAQLDDPESSVHPVGTGPFKLRQWSIADRVVVDRNPDYWRKGLPYLDSVEYVVAEDGSSRVARLTNGTFDVAYATHPGETAQLQSFSAGAGVEVDHDPGATDVEMVMFNTAKAPFDDVRVRRAVAYATDLPALAAANGWDLSRLADGPIAPSSPFHHPVAFPRNDLAKARALVADYERDRGPITFTLTAAFEQHTAQQLVEQWARAGITARLDTIDFKVFIIKTVLGQYDATLMRYYGAQDPDALWHFWSGETIRPLNQISLNLTRFGDPEIDRNLAIARANPDREVRKQAYAVVQQRFADEVPSLFMVRTDWTIARSRHVRDARNVTLPDGSAALPWDAGIFRPTETWLASEVADRP